jgi:hypothetical protein
MNWRRGKSPSQKDKYTRLVRTDSCVVDLNCVNFAGTVPLCDGGALSKELCVGLEFNGTQSCKGL